MLTGRVSLHSRQEEVRSIRGAQNRPGKLLTLLQIPPPQGGSCSIKWVDYEVTLHWIHLLIKRLILLLGSAERPLHYKHCITAGSWSVREICHSSIGICTTASNPRAAPAAAAAALAPTCSISKRAQHQT